MSRGLNTQSVPFQARYILLLLIAILTSCDAQDKTSQPQASPTSVPIKSKALYPVGGEIFYFTDTMNATFVTGLRTPKIKTWCNDQSNKIREMNSQNTTLGPGTVWALVPTNITSMVDCWLQLMAQSGEQKGEAEGVNTQHFRVEDKKRDPTTLGLPSVWESAQQAPSITSGPTQQDNIGGGLSSGAIAGICIGVIAATAAAVGGGFICWKKRKIGAETQSSQDGTEKTTGYGIVPSDIKKPEASPFLPHSSEVYAELEAPGYERGTQSLHR